jgi:hypothetical protein
MVSDCETNTSAQSSYHTESQDHAAPEQNIVEQSAASNPLAPLQHDDGHLQHHCDEAIAPKFPRNAAHDQFVGQSGDEERYCRGKRARHVVLRGGVDVSAKEMVNRLVPAPKSVYVSCSLYIEVPTTPAKIQASRNCSTSRHRTGDQQSLCGPLAKATLTVKNMAYV